MAYLPFTIGSTTLVAGTKAVADTRIKVSSKFSCVINYLIIY